MSDNAAPWSRSKRRSGRRDIGSPISKTSKRRLRAAERMSTRTDPDIRAAVLVAEEFVRPAIAGARLAVADATTARAAKRHDLLPRETRPGAPAVDVTRAIDAARESVTVARSRAIDLETRLAEADYRLNHVTADADFGAVAVARIARDVLADELPAARTALTLAQAAAAAAQAAAAALRARLATLPRAVIDSDDPWPAVAELEHLLGYRD